MRLVSNTLVRLLTMQENLGGAIDVPLGNCDAVFDLEMDLNSLHSITKFFKFHHKLILTSAIAESGNISWSTSVSSRK